MKKMFFLFILQSLLIITSDQSRSVRISTRKTDCGTIIEVPANFPNDTIITVDNDRSDKSLVLLPSGLLHPLTILVHGYLVQTPSGNVAGGGAAGNASDQNDNSFSTRICRDRILTIKTDWGTVIEVPVNLPNATAIRINGSVIEIPSGLSHPLTILAHDYLVKNRSGNVADGGAAANTSDQNDDSFSRITDCRDAFPELHQMLYVNTDLDAFLALKSDPKQFASLSLVQFKQYQFHAFELGLDHVGLDLYSDPRHRQLYDLQLSAAWYADSCVMNYEHTIAKIKKNRASTTRDQEIAHARRILEDFKQRRSIP